MPVSPRATGPVSARSPWRSALSSAADSSGATQPLGRGDPGAFEQVHAVPHERDQVVGAVRQRRVVERADRLGDPDRLGAHLHDQRLADAPGRLVAVGGGDPDAAGSPAAGRPRTRPVNVIAGCMASGEHAVLDGRREHPDAGRARGVHDDLAGPEAARRRRGRGPGRRARRPGRRAATRSDRVTTSSGESRGTSGQQRLGPAHRVAGHPAGGDDVMAGRRAGRLRGRPRPVRRRPLRRRAAQDGRRSSHSSLLLVPVHQGYRTRRRRLTLSRARPA